MSKFFYLDKSDLLEILDLIDRKDPDREIVLSSNSRFKDVVRFNAKYGTVVLITVPVDSRPGNL